MILFNKSKCTGCRLCETICSFGHRQVFNRTRSRIRIETRWPDEIRAFFCKKCKNPRCVSACPTGAIKVSEYGIHHDHRKCEKCYSCLNSCPFGVGLKDSQTAYPIFCDSCQGDYSCVDICPVQALTKKVV